MEEIKALPKEKFEFVTKNDITHDKKPQTKPVGYFKDAFKRFCKNKGSVVGAVIILILILFAVIAPFCTPYGVSYKDTYFRETLPKSGLFANTNFWDGCSVKQSARQDSNIFTLWGRKRGITPLKISNIR